MSLPTSSPLQFLIRNFKPEPSSMATVLQTRKDYEEKPSELLSLPLEQDQQEHDCSDFNVLTIDNEICCIKCGKIDEDETAIYNFQNPQADSRAFTAVDHNAGNGLLNSETMQQGYISKTNPGVTFGLCDPRGKDYDGKKIQKQLRDGYKTGLVAERGCHTEEDIYTGKVKVRFSRYDEFTFNLVKEKALQKCIPYGLDTVQLTLISQEIKRLFSQLVLSDITEYIILGALAKYKHFLPKSEYDTIDKGLIDCIESIRVKLVSGCCNKKSQII